ncbi:MAG TPA: PilX N-terminal domain-containing pilus assembly protein [Burkholderiales bacterium]|jgi:type IV pilus assembly protein PilX
MRNSSRRQRGAILIISLMFLVVLTMLALTTMGGITLEERMSGQYRDLNVAFQSAESALRDAERDVWGVGAAGANLPRAPIISGRTGFGDLSDTPNGTCSVDATVMGRGLCLANGTGPIPPFPAHDLGPTSAVAVPYGRFTNATQLPRVSAQPRYIIEAIWLNIVPPPTVQSLAPVTGVTTYYRITAQGFGVNPNSRITLQEMYLKPWN